VPLTLPPSMVPPSSFAGETGSQAFRDFVSIVSGGTGISPAVVTAWVLAEQPADKTDPKNPLNIGNPAYHGKDYKDAAAKVIALLRTPRYAPVLAAAKQGDTATIAAIARSPWDACHYAGTNPNGTCVTTAPSAWGQSLRGVYERVKSKGVASTITPGSVVPHVDIPSPGDIAGAAGKAAADAVSGAFGGLAGWAEGAGLRVLGYLTLTVVAVGVFLLGLVRLTGIGPGFIGGALAQRRAESEAVPF